MQKNSNKLFLLIISTLNPLCLRAQDHLHSVRDLLKLNSCNNYNEACSKSNSLKSKLLHLINKQIVTEQQVSDAIKENKINDLLIDAQVLEIEYGSGDSICGDSIKGGE